MVTRFGPRSRQGGGFGFRLDGVTSLAVQAVLLEIPVDLNRLYDGDDPLYELFLVSVVERVADAHRAQESEMKRNR